MASRVDSWYSQEIEGRDYVVLEDVRGIQVLKRDWDPDRRESVDATLYLDTETGLVTWSPSRFEEWLTENRLTPKDAPEQNGGW